MTKTWYTNKKPIIKNHTLKNIVDLKNKIINNNASEQELADLKNDLIQHLNTTSGTIENYCGKYGKSLVDIAIKHYPNTFDKQEFEQITSSKLNKLYSHIYDSAISGKKITIRANLLQMLTSYMVGEKSQTGTFSFSIPFVSSNNGIRTTPQKKEIKE